MKSREIDFILPIGYLDGEGRIHKKGRMREATALDEIEIYNSDEVKFNQRYYDIMIFSRLITKLGDISAIDTYVIENLFEADFRFLQTIYRELNGNLENEAEVRCPKCNNINRINLSKAYENFEFYLKQDQSKKEKE